MSRPSAAILFEFWENVAAPLRVGARMSIGHTFALVGGKQTVGADFSVLILNRKEKFSGVS
jgi:hypothetical protein